MMAGSHQSRTVRIAAPDGALADALEEHRPAKSGWSFQPLDGTPEADAIVIVDYNEPDDRRRSLEAIRAGGFDGPVLILGAISGIEGALPEDEPIARPVRLGTLLSRIDAHWAKPPDREPIMLGPYKFVPAERVLLHDDESGAIRLTELEHRLLSDLVDADGGLVGRAQLLARVWGYTAGVDTHTVETHIWRLRQKVETDDPATHFLVTEAGGYRLHLADSTQGD
jgi:DNA-binding response OmpR family regulator